LTKLPRTGGYAVAFDGNQFLIKLNPMKYTIKQQRTYTTYLTIEANNEAEAEKKYLELLDEGVAYEQELEQMNVDGEDYTILPQ